MRLGASASAVLGAGGVPPDFLSRRYPCADCRAPGGHPRRTDLDPHAAQADRHTHSTDTGANTHADCDTFSAWAAEQAGPKWDVWKKANPKASKKEKQAQWDAIRRKEMGAWQALDPKQREAAREKYVGRWKGGSEVTGDGERDISIPHPSQLTKSNDPWYVSPKNSGIGVATYDLGDKFPEDGTGMHWFEPDVGWKDMGQQRPPEALVCRGPGQDRK